MRGKGWTAGAVAAAALGAAAAWAERRRHAPRGSAPRPAAAPHTPPPSPDTDPFGALDAARERLRRRAVDPGADEGGGPQGA